MIWLLPICLVLITLLRLYFPELKKSFRSASALFVLALVMSFQNCGPPAYYGDVTTIGTSGAAGALCTSAGSELDPACAGKCIPTGQVMVVSNPKAPHYLPPCEQYNGVTYCPANGLASYTYDCPSYAQNAASKKKDEEKNRSPSSLKNLKKELPVSPKKSEKKAQ